MHMISYSGAKIMYRFSKGESRDIYLYGLGGQFRKDEEFGTPETVTGGSVGVGIEFSQHYMTDDLKHSVEFGYATIPFTDYEYSLFLSYGMRIYF